MTKLLLGIITILVLNISHKLYAQDEFFHEIRIEKELFEHEEWELFGEANFKYLYNHTPWRRWGVSLGAVREIHRFNVSAGFNSNYTFNRSITNFTELRPWSNIQYRIPVDERFTIRQRLRYEWRMFFTENSGDTRENYGRIRYQLSVDIPITGEKESEWTVRPIFEWFIIRDPATFERYPNERDFGVRITRSLRSKGELYFMYRLEQFYNTETESGNGHIFFIGYSF